MLLDNSIAKQCFYVSNQLADIAKYSFMSSVTEQPHF